MADRAHVLKGLSARIVVVGCYRCGDRRFKPNDGLVVMAAPPCDLAHGQERSSALAGSLTQVADDLAEDRGRAADIALEMSDHGVLAANARTGDDIGFAQRRE